MTGRADSGAVLTGKRRRAESSCGAAAAAASTTEESEQHMRQAKRQRGRTEHDILGTHWKPAPHLNPWPAECTPSIMEQTAGGKGVSSHLQHCSHFASRPMYAGCLATPATSPPSQGALLLADDRDEDIDQIMDEDDEDDDVDPNSEYYNINMLLKRLHEERELRRQQRHAQSDAGPG